MSVRPSICLSVCSLLRLSVHLSLYLSSVCLSFVSLSLCRSIYPSRLFLSVNIYLSLCLFITSTINTFLCLSVHCQYVCLPIHLSVFYPYVCLYINMPVYLSICLSSYPFVCLSIHMSVSSLVHLCIYLSVCQSICQSVCPSIGLSLCLSICPCVCTSLNLSISRSIQLSVCLLSVCPSVQSSKTEKNTLNKKLKCFYFFCFRTKDATYNPDEGYVKMYIRGRPVQVKSTKNLYFKIKSRSR